VGVVGLALLGVIAELLSSAKSPSKAGDHLISLHNITGICLSVMILAVLLPVGLPSTVSNLLSVRLPRDHKRQGPLARFIHTVVIPLLDVNNDGKVQWFELWTGVAMWVYSLILFSALLYFIFTDATTIRFIQLGGGMTKPVTTILVKGYFAVDGSAPATKKEEAKSSWLSWIDVNHDGRVTKIDIFCGVLVLVFALLECVNTVHCLVFPSTRNLLEQLIALPLLVVTLAALACFGPTPVNVPLFQLTAVVYFMLIVWFVVRVAWGVDTNEVGGWLDCVLKVGAGMAAATMQLVSTFLSKAVTPPKGN